MSRKIMIGLLLLSGFLPILGLRCGSNEEDKVINAKQLLGQ